MLESWHPVWNCDVFYSLLFHIINLFEHYNGCDFDGETPTASWHSRFEFHMEKLYGSLQRDREIHPCVTHTFFFNQLLSIRSFSMKTSAWLFDISKKKLNITRKKVILWLAFTPKTTWSEAKDYFFP